jgi:uncharacterized membrane protein
MQPIVSTITIERPREELYDLILDLRNHEAWTDHILVDWSGTDRRVRVRSALPGPKDWLDIEAQTETRPSETVERTVGAGGKRVSYGTYRLRELGPSSTEVSFELRIEKMPRRESALGFLVRPYLQRGNDKAMRRLKEHAEGRA